MRRIWFNTISLIWLWNNVLVLNPTIRIIWKAFFSIHGCLPWPNMPSFAFALDLSCSIPPSTFCDDILVSHHPSYSNNLRLCRSIRFCFVNSDIQVVGIILIESLASSKFLNGISKLSSKPIILLVRAKTLLNLLLACLSELPTTGALSVFEQSRPEKLSLYSRYLNSWCST